MCCFFGCSALGARLSPAHPHLTTNSDRHTVSCYQHIQIVKYGSLSSVALQGSQVRVPSLRSEYAQTLKPTTTGLLSAPGSAIPENLATPALSYLQSRETTAIDSKGMPPPAERFALSPYHSLRHSPTARRVSTSPYRYKKTNGNSGLRNRPEDRI